MDHAYLKVRHLQRTGRGGCSRGANAENSDNNSAAMNSYRSSNNDKGKIADPVYTENAKTYAQISSTLSSLHA